jgi:amino acid exporter
MNEISAYLPGILLAYSAFLLGIASPGPNVLAIMGTSMSVGRRSGIALALGIAVGSFLWALLTAGGLSAVLAAYAPALTAIKIGGGLYLLWLAWKSLRSAISADGVDGTGLVGGRRSPFTYFVRGLAIQMTNPKAALTWVAIISLGLDENAPLWVGISIVTGTTILSVILHIGYATLFSTPPMARLYSKARRWIQGGLSAFFGFAGVKLLLDRP